MREFVVSSYMDVPPRSARFHATAGASEAPGTPLEIGRSLPFESRLRHERRILDVTLPGGFEASATDRYPVVFVLDFRISSTRLQPAWTRFYARMAQLAAHDRRRHSAIPTGRATSRPHRSLDIARLPRRPAPRAARRHFCNSWKPS
jgi:hypothetical protein